MNATVLVSIPSGITAGTILRAHAPAAVAEPEVIKKGKKEEEDEAAEEKKKKK